MLISAVLDSFRTYFMACFFLPVGVVEAIDKQRRTFFLSDDVSCSGVQCLVAWKNVCTPKEVGGLGVKNILTQNFCLMLKFAFKFLHSPNQPWKTWLLHHSPLPVSQAKNGSYLAKCIHKCLDKLRQITQCSIGNGHATFFWLDRWFQPEPLAVVFPALFSHHLQQNATVQQVMKDGVELGLCNRLTLTAAQELSALHSLLQVVSLSLQADKRMILDGPFHFSRSLSCDIVTAS